MYWITACSVRPPFANSVSPVCACLVYTLIFPYLYANVICVYNNNNNNSIWVRYNIYCYSGARSVHFTCRYASFLKNIYSPSRVPSGLPAALTNVLLSNLTSIYYHYFCDALQPDRCILWYTQLKKEPVRFHREIELCVFVWHLVVGRVHVHCTYITTCVYLYMYIREQIAQQWDGRYSLFLTIPAAAYIML